MEREEPLVEQLKTLGKTLSELNRKILTKESSLLQEDEASTHLGW